MAENITIQTTINASIQKVWDFYTSPEHITQWNNASPDWHSPRAENDLRVGGRFNYRMEAKDGSEGFDFTGTYDEVGSGVIKYTMDDGRKVSVQMNGDENETEVSITFDPESENTPELQRQAGRLFWIILGGMLKLKIDEI